MAQTKREPYRVLIVDDEVATRQMLAELLQAPHRSIEVRDTPRAALEFLQHNPVDLAFVDLMMPGMSGAELAEKIKERYPRAHVVICTGYLAEPLDQDAKTTKADRIMHKPLDFGEVLRLADSYTTE